MNTPNNYAPKGYRSRKLWVTLIAFCTGISLSIAGKLDLITANFIVYIASIYIIGNVGNGIADKFRQR